MNTTDNRSAQRVMTVFKAARIGTRDADDLGLIRNISVEGVMVETQLELGVDDPVVIEIQSGRPIAGRVRWSRDGRAGIQLACQIDLTEALRTSHPEDVVDRIRPPRFDRVVAATLQFEGRSMPVTTRNISLSGLHVVTDIPLILPANAHVMLGVEGLGNLGAVLRWRRGSGFGLRFEHPLALRQFQQWLHRFSHAHPAQLAHGAGPLARRA